MVGRQLPFFSAVVPFWLVAAMAGWGGMVEVWPACLVSGVSFAVVQFLVSNYHGPWVVDIAGAIVSILALVALLRVWQPRRIWRFPHDDGATDPHPGRHDRRAMARAWLPWLILSLLVFVWGLPSVKAVLDHIASPQCAGPAARRRGLPGPAGRAGRHARGGDVHAQLALGDRHEPASRGPHRRQRARPRPRTHGPGVRPHALARTLVAADHRDNAGPRVHDSLRGPGRHDGLRVRTHGPAVSVLLPAARLAGVALTGSDTSSNVLFGNLQQITAQQVGVSPVLAAAANSSGGVMGKMIDAQSIVVAGVATEQEGQEGAILRYVFLHSLALATLVGLLVLSQAYLFPGMIP